MKFLMFVCGPNGSGKSSFTRGLGIQRDVPVLDPDMFSSQGVSDLGAGKIAIRQAREYMASGVSFIRESTLSSRLDLRLMEQARGAGYLTVLVYLRLSNPEMAMQRVQRRVQAGGHAIPAPDIERRFWRSMANLEKAQDMVDHCFILDNAAMDMAKWFKDRLAPLLSQE